MFAYPELRFIAKGETKECSMAYLDAHNRFQVEMRSVQGEDGGVECLN